MAGAGAACRLPAMARSLALLCTGIRLCCAVGEGGLAEAIPFDGHVPHPCGDPLDVDQESCIGSMSSVSLLQRELAPVTTKGRRFSAGAVEPGGDSGGVAALTEDTSDLGGAEGAAEAPSVAAAPLAGTAPASLLQASASSAAGDSAAAVAAATAGSAEGSAAGSAAGGAGTGGRPYEASSTGSTFLYVLPVLGFALALGAIAATVFLEVGWPGGVPPGFAKPGASPMRFFGGGSAAAARGRGAESLLGAAPAPARDDRLPAALRERQQAEYSQTPPVFSKPGRAPPMAPPAPPPAPAAAAPKPPEGPEVQVVVPIVPPGGVLGLNLSEADLHVTGFARPAAQAYGFVVGDRILAINGIPVSHQEEFVYWLGVARDRNASLREPIVFTVYRAQNLGVAHDLGGVPAGGVADEDWVGMWEYRDDMSGTGRHEYTIRTGADGVLRFEQVLPSGTPVEGALRRIVGGEMEADLRLPRGENYGVVRLRLAEGKASISSVLRLSSDAAWGAEILARKVDAMALPSPPRTQPVLGGL